jgi:hypothetical protein
MSRNVANIYKLGLFRCILASLLRYFHITLMSQSFLIDDFLSRPIPSCPPILPFALRLFTLGINDPCHKVNIFVSIPYDADKYDSYILIVCTWSCRMPNSDSSLCSQYTHSSTNHDFSHANSEHA